MQGFHPVFLLRYVGNNPIDEAQCTGLVIDRAGVQGCPEGAAVFTEKFHLKIRNGASLPDEIQELMTPLRIHIKLVPDVGDGFQQLFWGGISE